MNGSRSEKPPAPARLDLRRIAAGGSWLIAERILRIAASLFIGTWVARELGPEQFGILGYVATCFAFLAPLAGLGADQPALRLLATGGSEGTVVGTALFLRLGAGTILLALTGGLLALGHPQGPYPAVILALAIGSLFSAADACEWPFLATMANRQPTLVRMLAMAIAAGARIFLLCNGYGVAAFAWVLAAETAMGGMGLAWVWWIRGQRGMLRWDAGLARSLLRDGWPLALSGLLVMSYTRVDQILLQQLAGAEEVGRYLAAVRLAECWWMVPTAIAASATAGLVHAHAASHEAFLDEATRVFRLQSWLALPVVICLSVGSMWIIPFMFGPDYAGSVPMLAILAWSGWFVALGVTRSACLTATGAWRFNLVSTAIGAVTNIVLNLVLIPRLGGLGSAIATLTAQWATAHLSTALLGDRAALWKAMTRGMLLRADRRLPR